MSDSVEQFLAMHQKGAGFVLPNAWNAGTARILEGVGFAAIATTSAGIAFSQGRRDGSLTRDEAFDAIEEIVGAVDCPVSADIEAGYDPDPEEVASFVSDLLELGVVGVNLEDSRPDHPGELFDIDEATQRLASARGAGQFVLNARTDTFLVGLPDAFDEAVRRAQRFIDAGADCIFVPGAPDADTIRSLADAIDAPLNIVAGLGGTVLDAPALRSLGVARISVGGSLARAALGFVERAGREMLDDGTFGYTDAAISHLDLQERFRRG